MSVKFQGKPIESRVLAVVAVFYMAFMLIISAPLHPIFRLFGLRGIFRSTGDGTFEAVLDKSSFERR